MEGFSLEIYTLTDRKNFMNKLLKSQLFDNFELREAVVHTLFKTIVDGKRNTDFFTDEESELSTYLHWSEVRPYLYHLFSGHKPPTYFKLVFATSSLKAKSISEVVDTCFLNITFKDNQLTCSTGIAYMTFSLDKTPEKVWDDRIKKFLFQYEFM